MAITKLGNWFLGSDSRNDKLLKRHALGLSAFDYGYNWNDKDTPSDIESHYHPSDLVDFYRNGGEERTYFDRYLKSLPSKTRVSLVEAINKYK